MTSCIESWTCQIIEVPTHSRLDTSYGEAAALRPHVMVTLVDTEGRAGYGEASPLPMFTGETAASIRTQLQTVFLPALVGRAPLDLSACLDELDRLLPANSSAKAAVDIALHDLAGKILGQPVYRLLGGLRRPDGFGVSRAIGIKSIDQAVQDALHWTERGFKTLKMKVGVAPRTDIQRVRAVREAVAADVSIRIDANGGYDVPAAIHVLGALADAVEYCEQPVAPWNLTGLRQVRQATGVRVLADESVHGPRDVLRVIEAEAADLIAIKLIKCGGLRRGRQIAELAALADMHCVLVSPFETHVGAAANIHLALSLPPSPVADELSIFHVEPEGPYTSADVPTEDDRVLPPTAPGLAAHYRAPATPAE